MTTYGEQQLKRASRYSNRHDTRTGPRLLPAGAGFIAVLKWRPHGDSALTQENTAKGPEDAADSPVLIIATVVQSMALIVLGASVSSFRMAEVF
jgi:hypothetical protein